MGKGINASAMGQLLEGLTSVKSSVDTPSQETNVPSPSIRREPSALHVSEKPKEDAKRERICTSLNKELMDKIRTISEKEGIKINELITLGLDMVVSKYEETHGKVHPKKGMKGDIKKIFR
ncbi:MAG: ribbon-helix-helix domain-containing protein [Prevotella sp.]|nr:ribbon-helix-helix domain-containing protein [Prevotella sp.]